jgi:hypothetical protein
LDKNPYAVIYNQYGAVVGQLIGDGAVLSFTPANFTISSKSMIISIILLFNKNNEIIKIIK